MAEEFSSPWNYTSIRKTIEQRLAPVWGNATREQLYERVLALETQLYPFNAVLCSLLDKSWRGTWAASDLFPLRPEDNDKAFLVYVKGEGVKPLELSEKELAETEYITEDSINIADGADLGDRFSIISVQQQAPGASINCGEICLGDVRRMLALINEGPK